MLNIRYAQAEDEMFWYTLDKHLPKTEYANKVREKRAYILSQDDRPAGILRYNLFWDNIPFCTMLFIDDAYQGRGCGRQLTEYWEHDMKLQGYDMLMVSTQADESAQGFYRKLGYQDCGGLVMNIPGHEQPMELFLVKAI